VITVLRDLPEQREPSVRRDQQGRKALWGVQGPLGPQGLLDPKVRRVILALKDLLVPQARLARRGLPDPWVQQV
jgi:hypothetical protein